MTTWFVSRHQGAIDRAQMQGIEAEFAPHPEPDQVAPGDIVMGTLPIPIVVEICKKGARYFHLSLNLSPEFRGRELSAEDLTESGAVLEEFTATKVSHLVPEAGIG